jgi:hypothetical protein
MIDAMRTSSRTASEAMKDKIVNVHDRRGFRQSSAAGWVC